MSVTRIEKTSGSAPRMSRCVIKGDMVYVAGLTASDRSADIKGQTQQILDKIDDSISIFLTVFESLPSALLPPNVCFLKSSDILSLI